MAALLKFNRVELESIWDNLFTLWRDSREGSADLESGLERLILGLN